MNALKRSKRNLRASIHSILEPGDPGNKNISSLKRVIDFFIMGSIILSCIIIPLDYIIPELRGLWIKFEIVFAIIFTIEYLLRWYASENRVKYPFTFYAVIDLGAILPSLFLLSNNFLLLRLLRFARFLRLLKLIRYNYYLYNSVNNLKNKYSSFKDEYKLDHLGNLFLLSVMALIVGANILYFTETRFASDISPYNDYWKSYWNIIIVLVSGIEDKEPASLPGKIEVTFLLIAGICVVGMITAEIVSILVGKFSRKGKPTLKPLNSKMENHIVILGFNTHLDYIIRQVYRAFYGSHYILVVCRDCDRINVTIPEIYKKVLVVNGDPLHPEILKKADIESAKKLIILSEDMRGYEHKDLDNRTLMKAVAVSSMNRNLPLTIQLQRSSSIRYTGVLENCDFIVSSGYMEKLISQGVLNPGVTEIYRSLMTFSRDSNEFYKIEIPDNFEPKTFAQAGRYFFENRESVIPVGIYEYSPETDMFRFKINPLFGERGSDALKSGDVEIRPGDYLMVIAYGNPKITGTGKRKLYNRAYSTGKKERKLLKKSNDIMSYDLSKNSSFKKLKNNSVIICNVNRNLKNIIEELLYGAGEKAFEITIIVQNRTLWEESPQWHPKDHEMIRTIYGDPGDIEVLKNAGVKDCAAAVILADPVHGSLADGPSSLIAMAIEQLNPEIHTVMELINSMNREHIDSGIINEVVCLGDITEKLIAQNCFHSGVIEIFDELLTSGRGTPQIFLPRVPEKFYGKSYGEIYSAFLERPDPFIIIGFVKGDDFLINPEFYCEFGANTSLTKDDRLIIIAHDDHVIEI